MSAPSFWDRRRAAVQAEAEAEQQAQQQHDTARAEAALEAESDEEALARLDLPDPDTLSMGDDFSRFMARGVPTRLRNRALRRLWRSNPVLACVDGLNDYDGDYLTGATGNGLIATTYQVGKGLLAHVDDLARKRALSEAGPDTGEAAVASAPAAAEDIAMIQIKDETAPAPAETDQGPSEAETDRPPSAPRKMRFRFQHEANA